MADISITGDRNNTVIFSFEGTALSSFEKNRIGICVLHPTDTCTGRNCIITHTDDSTEQSYFPEEISPVQVFKDVRSMKWLSDKITCSIDFEGDVFETEDQRNWYDDSYKTYSTPLSIPFPVRISEGTRISRRVTVRTGANANFAELNRNRPGHTGNDFICFSIHPQENASDNLTLVENLKAQKQLVNSAAVIANNKERHVSPVTLQRRFNPNVS